MNVAAEGRGGTAETEIGAESLQSGNADFTPSLPSG